MQSSNSDDHLYFKRLPVATTEMSLIIHEKDEEEEEEDDNYNDDVLDSIDEDDEDKIITYSWKKKYGIKNSKDSVNKDGNNNTSGATNNYEENVLYRDNDEGNVKGKEAQSALVDRDVEFIDDFD